MSADLLREAAAKMRERADDVRRRAEEPDQWFDPSEIADALTEAGQCEMGDCDADAEHIASWHPAVALAVADWLDAEADDRAARVYLDPMDDALSDEAVAVARAYLGRDVVTSEAREAKR